MTSLRFAQVSDVVSSMASIFAVRRTLQSNLASLRILLCYPYFKISFVRSSVPVLCAVEYGVQDVEFQFSSPFRSGNGCMSVFGMVCDVCSLRSEV